MAIYYRLLRAVAEPVEVLMHRAPEGLYARLAEIFSRLAVGVARLRLQKTDDGWTVEAFDGRVHVASAYRAPLYWRGIKYRRQRLALKYTLSPRFTVPSNGFVVDIGANVGEFSKYALEKGCQVLAIEGDPKCVRLLERNLAEEISQSRVRIVYSFLWNEERELEIALNPHHAGTSAFDDDPHLTRTTVHTRTLKQIFEQENVQSIDFLKMDAEGAEPEVLLGAEDFLKRIQVLSIDCGPERQGQTTADRCQEILSEYSFECVKSRHTILAHRVF